MRSAHTLWQMQYGLIINSTDSFSKNIFPPLLCSKLSFPSRNSGNKEANHVLQVHQSFYASLSSEYKHTKTFGNEK